MSRNVTAVLTLLLAGCYSVDKPATFRCSSADPSCPAGQVCNGSTCVPEGSQLDGSVDQAGDLALVDGPATDQAGAGPVAAIFAGTGSAGTGDGPVATAQFNQPVGLIGDGKGAVYVADSGNHCIRKIESGAVSTVAGQCGTAGIANGPAASALFRNPTGILLTPQGQIIVSDSVNNCIRLIQNGQVSTLAGNCGLVGGYKEGPAASAEFRLPFAIMFNGASELIVADTANNCLRMIKQGTVSPYAGKCGLLAAGTDDGNLATARFRNPSGIWWDKAGSRLVVGDSANNCLRQIDATQVKTIAGTCGATSGGFRDGPATSALFKKPTGINVATDGIYVSDTDNHCLRRLSGTTVSTLAGNTVAGNGLGPSPEKKAVLNTPSGVLAIGTDRVLVADTGNHRILLIAPP